MADTYTGNYNLVKIEQGTTGWADKANGNMDTIDTELNSVSSRIDALGVGIGYVNVKDYGAKGDGVTDDTAALQAALNSSNKKIYIPTGDFICTSSLTINADTKICGDGPKLSVLKWASATGNGLVPVLTGNNITIHGIKLYSTVDSTGWAIYYEQLSDAMREFKFYDYEIEGFNNGVRLSYIINGYIGKGRMIGNGTGVEGIGLSLGNYPDIGVYGTTIEKSYISTYKFGYKGSGERSLLMLNPIIEGCWYPIHSEANGKITIVSPYFENNSTSYPLIAAEATTDDASGITVINPFVWNLSGPETDLESRVEGPRISIIYSGRDTVEQWGNDAMQTLRVYSSNNGHTGWLRFFRSHQNTKGLTTTTTGSSSGRITGYGVNSSSNETKVADILFEQDGSAGASYLGGKISFKVGTSSLDTSTALQVNAPANGEVGILVQRNDGGTLTLNRVTVGASDSGGSGFRVLRIPN